MYYYVLRQSLEKLSHDPNNKYWDLAVKSWCIELNLNKNEAKYIQDWIKNELKFLQFVINVVWSQREKLSHQFINKSNKEEIIMKLIILLAFIITAVGLLLYILNNKQKETTDLEAPENFNQADIQQNQTSKVDPIAVQPKPVQKSLILVIPATKYHLIESLINNQTVILNEQYCSNLYDATRYLCLDSSEKLSRQLSSINKELFVKQGEESASDIYFVKIDNINAKEQGFQPNANKNVKTNAFYRLVNLQAMVTPRYRIEAYQPFNVY
jgi:hypothetical protein